MLTLALFQGEPGECQQAVSLRHSHRFEIDDPQDIEEYSYSIVGPKGDIG